jgi:hypothetical protein
MTFLIRGGALAGGISSPLGSSLAFAVGVQRSTSVGEAPPDVQAAEALPGTHKAVAERAMTTTSPANLKL